MDTLVKFDSLTAELIAEKLEEKIKKMHPDAEMQKGAVVKVNNVWKNCITFKEPDVAISPTLYLDDAVAAIEAGHVTVDEVVENLSNAYEHGINQMPTLDVLKQINQDNLYAVVVNAEANQDKLATCPHMIINGTDLAVMCRVAVDKDASILITNEMCSMLEATPNEVVDRALKNVSDMDNWQVRSMQDVMIEAMGIPEELAEDFGLMDAPEMLVISDTSNTNAIGPFVSAELREKIKDKLRCEEEGYYIIPSSRFETIAIRADMDWKSVEEMVSEVNATQVAKEDQLSDHVYKVDGETLRISIAGQAENMTKTLSSTEKISPSMKI